jgi:hypothetical protein
MTGEFKINDGDHRRHRWFSKKSAMGISMRIGERCRLRRRAKKPYLSIGLENPNQDNKTY